MNSPDKEAILHIAHSFLLDAVGVMSCPISSLLLEKLSSNGPVPFVPDDMHRRISPESLLPGTKSIIVILFPYGYKSENSANIALYARTKDYHKIVHTYLENIIEKLKKIYKKEDFYAIADTSPLADRWLAYQAGLGFFGKNHCLIHPVYGSYFTIGSILTTLSLPPDKPLTSGCGDCIRCIDVCPGKCLTPGRFNPWQCKSYLTQKKQTLTPAEEEIIKKTPLIFGCDECQKYCPFNEKAKDSPLPEIKQDRISTLTKEELASLSNRGFLKKYREYAFSWRGRPVLLRNLDIIEKK